MGIVFTGEAKEKAKELGANFSEKEKSSKNDTIKEMIAHIDGTIGLYKKMSFDHMDDPEAERARAISIAQDAKSALEEKLIK